MAKLFFRYAAMNAGKSTQLIQVRHNYLERGQQALLLKPAQDTRDGYDVIRPRIGGGLEVKVDYVVHAETDLHLLLQTHSVHQTPQVDCILVDEAQFLSVKQVEQLALIADEGTPVLCYGIRADAFGELFPGSAKLMAIADTIEEMKTICWCGKKATMNARIKDGHVQFKGDQVAVGGNDMYLSLCRKHWREDNLGPMATKFQ
jgi:thymidine kinase